MEVRPSVLPLSFTFTYEIQTRCHNVLLYEVLMGYILTLFCRNSTQYKSWLSYSQGKQIHRGCKKGYFHLCNPTNVKKKTNIGLLLKWRSGYLKYLANKWWKRADTCSICENVSHLNTQKLYIMTYMQMIYKLSYFQNFAVH